MSEVNAIHHLNFLVRDLNQSMGQMQAVLNREPVLESLPQRQVKTARFDLNGTWLVLVQPLTADSAVGRILADRGEGLFLLSFGVDSLEASLANLQQRGLQADGEPRQGLDNWRVCDLAVGSGLGPVLQLCQT
ncbi:glyoxalase [Exilibacterium tricleocarpae]|uniref:Glyoxalase n=1 Tax=Exilibacterium tricleocarpae TaxID=2591008 RepID=A0A545TZP1_9GAMM|nr:VOC family protein [Exilibacterium tricleocarpae]TQV82675.1 glyoxalase [Exilibacterium tricleocarpae]